MKDTDRNRAVLAEVVARSWRDPAFRTSLKANPKQAVTAAGMQIPPNVEVVLLENTATIVHAVLPPRADMARYQSRFDATAKRWFDMPDELEIRIHRDSARRIFVVIPAAPAKATTGALSDRELEQVAGGDAVATSNVIATQTVDAVAGVAVDVVGVAITSVVAPCFVS
jgi:Nitrile hydratase, alpha chain